MPDDTQAFDGGCSVRASGSCPGGGTAVAALLFCNAVMPQSLEVQYTSRAAAGTADALVLLFAEAKDDELIAAVLPSDTCSEDMLELIQLHLLDQEMSCQLIPRNASSLASEASADASVCLLPFHLQSCCVPGCDVATRTLLPGACIIRSTLTP